MASVGVAAGGAKKKRNRSSKEKKKGEHDNEGVVVNPACAGIENISQVSKYGDPEISRSDENVVTFFVQNGGMVRVVDKITEEFMHENAVGAQFLWRTLPDGTKTVTFLAGLLVCYLYNAGRGCDVSDCGKLHVCREFVSGTCLYHPNCKFSHRFHTKANKKVLSKAKLGEISEENIKSIVKNSLPKMCYNYNVHQCHHSDQCPFSKLHLCQKYIKGSCMTENCDLSHSIHDSQNQKVFSSYHINIQQIETREVYATLILHEECDDRNHDVTVQKCQGPSKTPDIETRVTKNGTAKQKPKEKAEETNNGTSCAKPEEEAIVKQKNTGKETVSVKSVGSETKISKIGDAKQNSEDTKNGTSCTKQKKTSTSKQDSSTGKETVGDKSASSGIKIPITGKQKQKQKQKVKETKSGTQMPPNIESVKNETQTKSSKKKKKTMKVEEDESKVQASKLFKMKPDIHIYKDTTVPICIGRILGKCKMGGICPYHHLLMPYQWIFQITGQEEWFVFEQDVNEKIEQTYSSATFHGYMAPAKFLKTTFDSSEMVIINFESMMGNYCGRIINVCRLSTPSSVTMETTDEVFALTTRWIWYLEDDSGILKPYLPGLNDEINTADDNGEHEFRFTSTEGPCVLYFDDMEELNLTTQIIRRVYCAPAFISQTQLKDVISSAKIEIPVDTISPQEPLLSDVDMTEYTIDKLEPTSTDYQSVEESFKKTMAKAKILRIQKIHNTFQLESYQRRKEYMEKKFSGATQDIEKYLFHGTDKASAQQICKDSFDFRICGKNATKHGKGTYFARDARFSHKYAKDENVKTGTQCMFLARVLVGRYTEGKEEYKKPPENFDCCVNKINKPTVFVTFRHDHSYPEYLITYCMENVGCDATLNSQIPGTATQLPINPTPTTPVTSSTQTEIKSSQPSAANSVSTVTQIDRMRNSHPSLHNSPTTAADSSQSSSMQTGFTDHTSTTPGSTTNNITNGELQPSESSLEQYSIPNSSSTVPPEDPSTDCNNGELQPPESSLEQHSIPNSSSSVPPEDPSTDCHCDSGSDNPTNRECSPVSDSPVSDSPISDSPVSGIGSPISDSPVSDSPISDSPVSGIGSPISDSPVSDSPISDSPVSGIGSPISDSPVSDSPISDSPVSGIGSHISDSPVSGIGSPISDSPVSGIGSPISDSPVSDSPISDSPVSGIGSPISDSPVSGIGSPISDSPVSGIGSPISDSPISDSPISDSPVSGIGSPISDSPVSDSPISDSPVSGIGSPISDSPVSGIGSPISDSPISDSPVSDSPISDSPVSDSPISDSPVSDSPISDSPVSGIGSPISDSPVSDSPISDYLIVLPISDSPVSGSPISDSPVSGIGSPISDSPVSGIGSPISDSPISDSPVSGIGSPISDSPVSDSPISDSPVSGIGSPISDSPVSGIGSPISDSPISDSPVSGIGSPISDSPVSGIGSPISDSPVSGSPISDSPVSGIGSPISDSPVSGIGSPISDSPVSDSPISDSPVSGIGSPISDSPVSGIGSPISDSPVSGIGSPISDSPISDSPISDYLIVLYLDSRISLLLSVFEFISHYGRLFLRELSIGKNEEKDEAPSVD
ncbi:uncharacterized protein LOC144451703 [Glandiceps talaboti]